jgi:hypothetical protein
MPFHANTKEKSTRRALWAAHPHGVEVGTRAHAVAWARALGRLPGVHTYALSRRGHGPGGWKSSVVAWDAHGAPLEFLRELFHAAHSFLPIEPERVVTHILSLHELEIVDSAWRLGGHAGLLSLLDAAPPLAPTETMRVGTKGPGEP